MTLRTIFAILVILAIAAPAHLTVLLASLFISATVAYAGLTGGAL